VVAESLPATSIQTSEISGILPNVRVTREERPASNSANPTRLAQTDSPSGPILPFEGLADSLLDVVPLVEDRSLLIIRGFPVPQPLLILREDPEVREMVQVARVTNHAHKSFARLDRTAMRTRRVRNERPDREQRDRDRKIIHVEGSEVRAWTANGRSGWDFGELDIDNGRVLE
jgi:hypothetical protein